VAISILQEAHNENPSGGGTATTIAVTLTVTPGSALHVYVMENATGGGGTISLSDNQGQTYTLADIVNDSSRLSRHFYLIGAAAGSTTITATFSLGAFVAGIWVKEIANASAFQVSAGQFQIAPGAGTDAVTTPTVTPTSQPALVSAFTFGDNNADTTVIGTGFTLGLNTWPLFGATNVGVSESLRITSTAAIAATWTATAGGGANRWKSVVAVFTEAAGGAASQVPFTSKQPAFIPDADPPVQRRTRLVVGTPGPPGPAAFTRSANADVARRAWDPTSLEEAVRRRPGLVVDTPGPPGPLPFSRATQTETARRAWDSIPPDEALRRRIGLVVDTPAVNAAVPFSRVAQADALWRAWDPLPLDLAVIRRAKIVVDTPALNAAVPFTRAAQPLYYPIAELYPIQRVNRIPVSGPDVTTQVPFTRAALQQVLSQWTDTAMSPVLARRFVPLAPQVDSPIPGWNLRTSGLIVRQAWEAPDALPLLARRFVPLQSVIPDSPPLGRPRLLALLRIVREWEPPDPMPPMLRRSAIAKVVPPNSPVTPPLLAFVGIVELTLAEIGGPTSVVVATIDLTTAEVGGPSQFVIHDDTLTMKGDT
jgi:hypothetical protein